MKIQVNHTCADFDSYRAARVKAMFNCESGANFALDADLPIDDDGWQIGVIVGPSGSGKTSMGRQVFGPRALWRPRWPKDAPIIDAIAPGAEFDTVPAALSAVGLGSVPAWPRLPATGCTRRRWLRACLSAILDAFWQRHGCPRAWN